MNADNASLRQRLQRLSEGHVLVVGDVILDRYVYGATERISPEAPVPILKVARESEMLGGAGNVVRNLHALGAAATIVSVVGDDAEGRTVEKMLALPRIRSMLAIDPARRTSLKTRYVAQNQQLLRTDHETTMPLGAGVEAEVTARIKAAISAANVVVLSDYAKGVLTEGVIAAAINAAKSARKPVIVDPKSRDFGRYRGATLIAPNRKELAEATGLPTRTHSEVEVAANQIRKSFAFEVVLATRGEDGMTLVDDSAALDVPVPIERREVFDVSGAGDTVIASVAAGLAAKLRLLEVARIAQCAAGIVVGKAGTAVAYPEEIVAELMREDGRLVGKILSRPRALERVELWRRRGQRVGFTNGCFDLLHPGHIHLLKQARAACDRLVVGLNSDDSVRRLKGKGRPVQDEAARAAVLAGLADVDLVTVFDEDTPEALIAALRPDVLVKGADYTLETVVGADLVRSYGGRIVLAELLPGHSTSATVAKIR